MLDLQEHLFCYVEQLAKVCEFYTKIYVRKLHIIFSNE